MYDYDDIDDDYHKITYNMLKDKTNVPDKYIIFDCYNKNLTELPKLHDNIKTLYCPNNNLTILQKLPKYLTVLDCSCNNLIELPILPKSIYILCCSHNNLTELPELSYGLEQFECCYNNIKYLSEYNVEIIKNIDPIFLEVLNNPFSNNFQTNEDFIESLIDN